MTVMFEMNSEWSHTLHKYPRLITGHGQYLIGCHQPSRVVFAIDVHIILARLIGIVFAFDCCVRKHIADVFRTLI